VACQHLVYASPATTNTQTAQHDTTC
jgi:hypothetical protein